MFQSNWIPVLLSICTIAISACPSPNETLLLYKRTPWFGVGNPSGDEPWTNNGWPPDRVACWDRPVRYCWASKASYDKMKDLLNEAVGLWKPAMGDFSSLRIIPDGGNKNPAVLCSDAAPDALQLTDLDSSNRIFHATTTLGYWAQSPDRQTRGRHRLAFERIQRDEPKGYGAYDVATLAHELGHAIGLEHEHTRPDRDEHILFNCFNLRDFEAVKSRLVPPDTIAKACTDLATATKYGFSAFAFIKTPLRAPRIGQLAWSKTFDLSSIMIYSSYEGASVQSGQREKATMLSRTGAEFWCGGQPPWKAGEARISAGDMARVAQLYPVSPICEQNAARKDDPAWAATSSGILAEQTAMCGKDER